ncbi:aminopeptidase [[Eubacterium] cellulosolvens]
MINTSKIEIGVQKILARNMGLRAGERLLVITDSPSSHDLRTLNIKSLDDMLKRNLLARSIANITERRFPGCNTSFSIYPSTSRHSAEPEKTLGSILKKYDVVLAITTYSLSHTDARQSATNMGVRIASMPSVLEDMFYDGGSMTADYTRIASETMKITKILNNTSMIRISTKTGTDFFFSIKGRKGLSDTGILNSRGDWGNLPAGESYIAPEESTANGIIIIEAGWFPNLKRNMKLVFESGNLIKIVGGGDVRKTLMKLIQPNNKASLYLARRCLAEFGIGTNPKATRRDNILEAEKMKGTIHIAIGDNSHMGGLNKADLHQDFVIRSPTVKMDNTIVLKNGKVKFR